MILGKNTCLELAEKTIKEALNLGATQAEARIQTYTSYLTRFANSIIHQNVGETNVSLILRFIYGKKISTVSINEVTLEAIRKLAETGLKIAKVSEEDPEFISLPEPQPIKPLEGIFVKETAECTADMRAEMVKELIDEAHAYSSKVKAVAGALSTTVMEFSVANSLGVRAYTVGTMANLSTNIISRENDSEGFGYAGDVSLNVNELKPAELGREAAERSVGSLGAKTIEPGEYEVILEPYAVITALGYTRSGFSAQSYMDGTSFMNDLINKKAFSEKFTLWDDGRDLRGIPTPFDVEGIPKRKIMLVEEGVPKSLVYDSYTAHKEGKKSTGHATGYIPMPTNLFMKTGDSTKEEMIKETKKGLLVTRFHYVRYVHQRKLVITGMTRDGTWYIENGEIKYPVRNLRFTDSLLRTYANMELVGREVKRSRGAVAPAVKAKIFRFTGVTKY
ncbi:MAG: TldD/PmbA family protein [archaeon GB-1867-097]|nr:TldD/PmbA family protein [Candidatus Culexmicrobium thermophilum]MCS7384663.1 TldD/PmbA family protein [Candidatus Culexmicrobium thermophilum]RLE57120.1 MAG: hypothetical protein DRJ30_00745 [Candidatus Verstraetearchaeota archaeon]HDO20242.1 TldD/PmbA family protein [Candidatus Bathyarchaeota archaeon]